MTFKLSAMAPSFCMPPHSSASTTELPLSIICRENDEIGVYEGGVLKPRKGVTSLIAWKEKTPFTRALASATDARHGVITPTPSATPEKDATLQTASPLLGPSANEELQTTIAGGNTLDFYPEPTLFHYQIYALPLPCDIAVAEANRPGWNPAYHKTISPSIERANQVVEEFKVYFGDGRSPELLLVNLQKICILCGLCEASNLPKTSEDCITMLKTIYINVFDLVEAGRADQHGSGQKIQVATFKSSKEFFEYSKQQGKICPRWIGKANPLFQDVMTRFRG